MDNKDNKDVEYMDQLKVQIEALKMTAADFLVKKDEMNSRIDKKIQNAYIIRFGVLEYKLSRIVFEIYKIIREIKLIKATVDRGQQIDLIKIQMMIEIEFKRSESWLNVMKYDIDKASEYYFAREVNDAKEEYAKNCYKSIVRKISPRLNCNLTEDDKRLFYSASRAYAILEIDTLKMVDMLVDRPSCQCESQSIEDMENCIVRLKRLIKSLKKNIEKKKDVFPYTLSVYLDDEKKALEYEKSLNESIAIQSLELDRYKVLKRKLIDKYKNQ